ncbi:MAG: SnoaL-like domain-containing protein [Pyrinomonadaceae bacterium]
MEQQITELIDAKVELMKQGKMIEATEQFFAENAETIDFSGVVTRSREEMVEKMEGFLGSIAKVNGITFHNSAVNGKISFVEFTFDFDMADGSKVLWHEVIRSVWENGRIVSEQFFQA